MSVEAAKVHRTRTPLLDGAANYRIWSETINLLLKVEKFWSYVEGTRTHPVATGSTDATADTKPA